MTIEFIRLNHITIPAPSGEQKQARRFYGSVLGLKEVLPPKALEPYYDLIWYEMANFLLHIDFSPPYIKPAENHHPCIEIKQSERVRVELKQKGADIREAVPIPGRERFYVVDPFGNYFEFLEIQK